MHADCCAAASFYARAIDLILDAGCRFLVGGTYALRAYTGIQRPTKDLDLFCLESEYPGILARLAASGYRTEVTNPSWIAKIFHGDRYIDLIFSSGNGVCDVDDSWFQFAPLGRVLNRFVPLVPPEEMIWSKAFIQERERFDGADVLHLIHCQHDRLDWQRLLDRFDPHWEVFLAHLLNYRFVYPADVDAIPTEVMDDLLSRASQFTPSLARARNSCRGDLLSSSQYDVDFSEWGYDEVDDAQTSATVA
ncbi:MAG TPA: hypothetical protein VHX16_05295 [Chloroflexota bacterium]|nr:hypothetical protein [Chloroflexota bacterium]